MVAPAPVKTFRRTSRKSQTVERAALLLACFSAAAPHRTLGELAAQLELNPSTIYRYAVALQEAGLLERDEQRGGYRLGLRVVELAGIVLNQIEVRKQALDEMRQLRDEIDVHTMLGVLFEGDVLHLEQMPRRHLPVLYTGIGQRAPAHCTAVGKILLAELQDEAATALVERFGWRPRTKRSITTAAGLRRTLAEVRKLGFATAEEEMREGIWGIAVPVRDYSGSVRAALGVTGTKQLLEDVRTSNVLRHLRQAAGRISFRLGFNDEAGFA
ncbi:MAG: IclR family transcriptional regulator [Chloroflexi bacterium]|nr:IclR family transcriptional regulator [Chloroflexota bacterium]